MNDTSPEIEDKMREMLMARSGNERMTMAASMFDAARAIVLASFPKDLSQDEVKRRLVQRTYGVELDDFLENRNSVDEDCP